MNITTKMFHYSGKPIEALYKVDQPSCDWKPKGLYCAPETDWLDWCESAGFRTSSNEYKYELIGDLSELLTIDLKNVEEFEKKYEEYYPTEHLLFMGFRWDEVAKNYPGVWIKYNELYGTRPWRSWVCALDVVTVVIWDPSGFSVKRVKFNHTRHS